MGKVRVSNGKETLEIDGSDLNAAVSDGYKPTQRIIVANSKTKETYEVDPNDVAHALKDGFTYSDIAKQSAESRQPTQPAFHIDISQPFANQNAEGVRGAPASTYTTPQGNKTQLAKVVNEPTILPQGKEGEYTLPTTSLEGSKGRTFSFEKQYDPLAVSKLGGTAREAQTKVHAELHGNDKQYEKLFREYRRDNYTIDNLRSDYEQEGMILSPQDEQKTLQKEKQKRYDAPVTPQDITDMRTGVVMNHGQAAKFINRLNNPDASANALLVNRFNQVANDPNGNNRVEKIKELAKQVRKGNVIYDADKDVAIKPVGIIGSILEGVTNKFKAEERHDFFKNAPDAAIISQLEDERNNPNVDDPITVPKGKVGEALKSIAEMPIAPIVAGVAGTVGGTFIGNPELGTIAATSLGAYENRKSQYTSTFGQVYNDARNQGLSEFESLNKARQQAENAQEIGTIVGAAQGLVGAKMAAAPLKFSPAYQQTIGQLLKQNGSEFGKILMEGAAQGGLAATGEVAKNKLAQIAGINRDIDSGTSEQFWSNLLMTAGIGAAIKAGRGLTKANYKTVLNGLKNVPEETINTAIQEKVNNGEITQDAANNALNQINEYRGLDKLIPENVTEEARFKIQDKILKINEIEAEIKQTHESYHPKLKEEKADLIKDILALSKETEKPIKIESGLTKNQEKEAIETAQEFVAENIIPEIYHEEVSKDPIKFWRTIAQQAQNRGNNWEQLTHPLDEQVMKDKWGDTVVDYAKELFPAPEIGAGKASEENIGHVEVSEHGEDTKTAAGQENGIEPSKLSEKGIEEAKDLGKYLVDNNKNKIVTSEVERAKQTANEAANEAKNISGKEVPVESTQILNTWDIGEFDGKPEGSFNESEWASKPNEAPKGGESFNDFTKRMEQANEYIKSLPEDTHVVTHSKVMRALEALKQTEDKWTDETTNIFLNNKELTHAIQEPSPGSILQYPQEGIGIEGGERGGMEPSEQGEILAGTRSEEESKGTSEEKIAELKVDEAYGLPFIEEPGDKKTGIKNIISKTTRFERKLPKVEVDKLGSDQQIIAEGKDLVDNDIINPLDVVNRILDTKGGMEPQEAKAMLYYMHQLAQHETNLRESLAHATNDTDRAEINGQLQQLSDEVDAATQANIISGKAWSDVGNIRQIVIDNGFNASRDLATIKEAYGGKIPKEVQDRLNKITKERDEALNNLAKLQAEEKTKSAEDAIKKEGASKNPKKTKEDFKNERNDIKKSISDKLKKGRSGESGLTAVPLPFAKELIAISPEIFKLIKSYAEEGVQKTEEVINRLHDALKDEIQGIQKADIVNLLAGRYKAQEGEVSPISQRIRDFRTEANLWTKIAEATKMEEDTPAKREEKNQKLRDLKDRLNEIRTRNKETIKSIQDILTSDAQKELKKLEQRRKSAESQLRNKKYLIPKEKKNTPLTNAIIREKQRIVNANYKIKGEKRRAFESQKNLYQKGLMWAARMTRLSILSGYGVLGKLAAASTIGGAVKRIPEQAIGYIYGQIFRGIAEKAPIEGMPSAAAEAKFYKEFFNPKTFAKNAWQILKSGESPLSKQFSQGQFEHVPGLYLPTDLHQIIKEPLKRSTYEASFKNGLAWAERNGLDINDELVIQSIQNAAHKRAQYEIFQESNALTRKFGEFRANMEKKGNIGATGRALVDFMIPVSSVPTNIARRLVTTSPAGLIRGGTKVIEAYRKGIENLSPEEADAVMKQLKQGTLGTALWMIGWFGYKSFGGLYSKFNPNKDRDEGELASDEMSVNGEMVPKPVQHALPLEIIQFAATARRVYDNYKDNKGASTAEAIEKAGLASIGALTEQIPVVETVAHTIGAVTNPYEAKKLEEDVVRRVQPQILKETGVIGKKEGGSGGGAGASGHYGKKGKSSHSKHSKK